MDYGAVLFDIVLVALLLGFFFRARLRKFWIRLRLKAAPAPSDTTAAPQLLTGRLYELDKIFAPFGNEAAHPSALYAKPEFVEAVRLLAAPNVPLSIVLQYVEGNSWSLSSAALAALKRRADRNEAIARVLIASENFSPWAMFFSLDYLFEAEPRPEVGVPVLRARDWWAENRWMPNVFRDHLARCEARGDVPTFGPALPRAGAKLHETMRNFLQQVEHPFAGKLIEELDAARPPSLPALPPEPVFNTLNAVGRFWADPADGDVLVEPAGWNEALALAEATLRHDPPRSLLVSSAQPGEGKTTVSANLAISLAQLGQRVLLIDGDLRRPSVHRAFRIQDSLGVVSYLTGQQDWRAAVEKMPLAGLDVLVCGPVPPNPAELLSSGRMQTLVQEALEEYKFVVLDSPPLLNVSDSRILATLVEGVVLVVKGGETPRELAQRAHAYISDVGARVIGAVLNNIDLHRDEYSYYQAYSYDARGASPDAQAAG